MSEQAPKVTACGATPSKVGARSTRLADDDYTAGGGGDEQNRSDCIQAICRERRKAARKTFWVASAWPSWEEHIFALLIPF